MGNTGDGRWTSHTARRHRPALHAAVLRGRSCQSRRDFGIRPFLGGGRHTEPCTRSSGCANAASAITRRNAKTTGSRPLSLPQEWLRHSECDQASKNLNPLRRPQHHRHGCMPNLHDRNGGPNQNGRLISEEFLHIVDSESDVVPRRPTLHVGTAIARQSTGGREMSLVRLLGFTTLGCGCVIGRYRELVTSRALAYVEEKGTACDSRGHRRNHIVSRSRTPATVGPASGFRSATAP